MRLLVVLLLPLLLAGTTSSRAQSIFGGDGVFVRLQLVEPADATWHVALGGYIHNPPWYLKAATLPEAAAKDRTKALPTGVFTEWFDLKAHNGKALHGRLNRAGGVAEFPNVTANFVCQPPATRCRVIIELATAADAKRVVKRFEETFTGTLTSFLVSPDLVKDKDSLETAAQMSARRLDWARTATSGQRVSPKELIVQTGFWGPQRAELNAQEAEVLWLLGFNVVGNQAAETRERFPFRQPGHTHHVQFGPEATREQIEALMQKQGAAQKSPMESGVPFNFADEICARPGIGSNALALAHFRAWLAARGITAQELGGVRLDEVLPIETPADLRAREQVNGPAARRIFYFTSRFRQLAGTQRVKWHTEAYHRHFPGGGITSTLVADHPYFSGTGLGMGMVPNMAWGGAPLALDWFDPRASGRWTWRASRTGWACSSCMGRTIRGRAFNSWASRPRCFAAAAGARSRSSRGSPPAMKPTFASSPRPHSRKERSISSTGLTVRRRRPRRITGRTCAELTTGWRP